MCGRVAKRSPSSRAAVRTVLESPHDHHTSSFKNLCQLTAEPRKLTLLGIAVICWLLHDLQRIALSELLKITNGCVRSYPQDFHTKAQPANSSTLGNSQFMGPHTGTIGDLSGKCLRDLTSHANISYIHSRRQEVTLLKFASTSSESSRPGLTRYPSTKLPQLCRSQEWLQTAALETPCTTSVATKLRGPIQSKRNRQSALCGGLAKHGGPSTCFLH